MIPEDREQLGMVIIIVVCANVALAVGILTTESLKESVRQCKMRKMRRDAVKAMKEIKEQKAELARRTAHLA